MKETYNGLMLDDPEEEPKKVKSSLEKAMPDPERLYYEFPSRVKNDFKKDMVEEAEERFEEAEEKVLTRAEQQAQEEIAVLQDMKERELKKAQNIEEHFLKSLPDVKPSEDDDIETRLKWFHKHNEQIGYFDLDTRLDYWKATGREIGNLPQGQKSILTSEEANHLREVNSREYNDLIKNHELQIVDDEEDRFRIQERKERVDSLLEWLN